MRKIVSCAILALFAGCSAAPQIQSVKVPIPVPCQASIPDRPAMPTESLPQAYSLDLFVAAAAAEIERREGYEKELRAALSACTAPLPAGEAV